MDAWKVNDGMSHGEAWRHTHTQITRRHMEQVVYNNKDWNAHHTQKEKEEDEDDDDGSFTLEDEEIG